MKKLIGAMTVLILCTGLVFAGGSSEKAAESGTPTISFMWWGDDARNQATNQAVADFMAANPDIKVTSMPNPFDGYHDKIIIQLANGTAPDLFCFSTEWLSEVGYEENPVLLDLYSVTDTLDLSTLSESSAKAGEVNGKLLGIPTGISGWSWYYSLNAMNEYCEKTGESLPPGVDGSWTIDEFMEFGAKFHDVMGDDIFLFSPSRDAVSHLMFYILSEYAGKFYIDANCNIQFTEENLRDTLTLMQKMTEEGILPEGTAQVESFAGNTISTTHQTNGTWVGTFDWNSNIVAFGNNTSSEVGILAYPNIGGEEFNGLFVRPAQFWSISSKSKNVNSAAILLNYILNDPTAALDLGLTRSVPPTAAGQNVLADAGQLVGPTYDSTQYLQSVAASSYHPFILLTEVKDAVVTEYSKFIIGEQSLDDTTANLMRKIEKAAADTREDMGL